MVMEMVIETAFYHQMLTYSCLRVDRKKFLRTNQQNLLMYPHTE